MRHLTAFGILMLFLAISFVPPPRADYLASAKAFASTAAAKDQLHTVAKMPTFDGVQHALENTMSYVSDVASATPAIQLNVHMASQAVSQLADSATSAINEVQKQAYSLKDIRNWDDLVAIEKNGDIQKQFARIQQAVKDADSDECRKLGATVLDNRVVDGKTLPMPSANDMLLYCLARVTHLKQRCENIATAIALPLKSLCQKELSH